MRVFILASLSTSAIIVPNNTGMTKPASPDNSAPADGSPFAAMLTATAPAAPAKHDKDEAAADNAAAPQTSQAPQTQATQTHATQAQAPKTAADAGTARTDGKSDGKTGGKDDSAANDNGDTSTSQTSDAQPQPSVDAAMLPAVQAQLAAQVQTQPVTPAQQTAPANDDDNDGAGAIGTDSTNAPAASIPAPAALPAAMPAQLAAAAAPVVPKTSSPASGAKSAGPTNANQTNADPAIPGQANADPATPPLNPVSAALAQGSASATDASKGVNSDSKSADTGTDTNTGKPPVQTADATPQLPQPASAAPNLAALTNSAAPAAQSANHPAVISSVAVSAQPAPDVNALAVSIAARSQSGARQFDIRLDPPELGRVEVRLSIDANGKTEAHMTADQPQTLSMLQKDSSSLTQALRDAGLDVSDNGLNFSLRSQGEGAGGNNQNQGGASLAASQVVEAVQNASTITYSSPAGDGRVDISV